MSENFLDGVVRGLSRNVAFTSPGAEDPRLRGRTYAIPFEDVWQSTRTLVSGKLKRWELVEADDQEGLIRGVAHGRLDRFTSAITIRITLDPDAQTRVDAMSASQVGRADLGVNARRLRRYFAALDAMLAERRGTTIDSLTVGPSGASSATP